MGSHTKIFGSLLAGAVFIASLLSGGAASAESLTARVEARYTHPGTLLVFPMFDIQGEKETTLRIFNNSTEPIGVALYYNCPGVIGGSDFCQKLDRHVELTPYETRIVDVSDHSPPCEKGFVMAWAENSERQPISFNHLLGSYTIDSGSGRHVADNAFAIASVRDQGQILGNGLKFQFGIEPSPATQDFPPIGDTLYTDFTADGPTEGATEYGTRLVLLNLDILIGQQNPRSVVALDFWNEAEEPFSSSREFICWDDVTLSDIDSNFLDANLGTDYGAVEIEALPNCPVPGACPPFNPVTPTLLGAVIEYDDGTRAARHLKNETIEVEQRLMFVTSNSYDGNLGGLAGADAICNNLAGNAGLPGYYKAWLSTSQIDARDRFVQDDRWIVRTDRKTVIAYGFADLVDGNGIQNPVRLNENQEVGATGSSVAGTNVWTATDQNGEAGIATCLDWSATLGSGATLRGNYQSQGTSWTNQSTLICDNLVPFYCLQDEEPGDN